MYLIFPLLDGCPLYIPRELLEICHYLSAMVVIFGHPKTVAKKLETNRKYYVDF